MKQDNTIVVCFALQMHNLMLVMQYHCSDRVCSSGELVGPLGSSVDRFNVTGHVSTLNEDKTAIITAYTTNLNNLGSLHVCGVGKNVFIVQFFRFIKSHVTIKLYLENKTLETRDEPGKYCTNPLPLDKLNEKQQFSVDATTASPLSPAACAVDVPVVGSFDNIARSRSLPVGPALGGRGVWLAPDFDALGVDCVTVTVCALTTVAKDAALSVDRYSSSCPDVLFLF